MNDPPHRPATSEGRRPAREAVPNAFERDWRERFAEFAELHDDDAGIAGWSSSGLATRFRFFRQRWRAPATGRMCLDVGCGAGTYTRWLAEQGFDVVGVDYSQPALVKAKARSGTRAPYCAANATCLPFRDASFDVVVCLGLLQAMPDSAPVVHELARVIRPSGELWIDALNERGLAARIDRARRRARGAPMHLRYETPTRLAEVLDTAGLDVVARHWLPMAPSRQPWLQRLLDSGFTVSVLRALPLAGATLSHSFVLQARRRE